MQRHSFAHGGFLTVVPAKWDRASAFQPSAALPHRDARACPGIVASPSVCEPGNERTKNHPVATTGNMMVQKRRRWSDGPSASDMRRNSATMKTMPALVKKKAEPGLWLEEVPVPDDRHQRRADPGAAHRHLRHRRAHLQMGRLGAAAPSPCRWSIGHEFVGEIVEVGSNVTDFHPGDIVSGEGHVVCGRCRNCLAGRRHLCADTQGVGVNRPGAFAEYIALPMTNVWRHDAGIDPRRRRRSSIRSATPSTPRCRSPCWARTC